MCEALYNKAFEWLETSSTTILLDICCGVGTIGLCFAKMHPHITRVVGFELVEDAITAARVNAANNGIAHAEYIAGKAEVELPKYINELGHSDEIIAIVDPPRAGLHVAVVNALLDCRQICKLVYISCNAESLANDCSRLCGEDDEDSFMVERAVCVDMFPHTYHCEAVTLLSRCSSHKHVRPKSRNPLL